MRKVGVHVSRAETQQQRNAVREFVRAFVARHRVRHVKDLHHLHGRGVGSALTGAIIERARAAGYRRMRLETSHRQVEAQSLHARPGFATAPPYYDLPGDLRAWLVFMHMPTAIATLTALLCGFACVASTSAKADDTAVMPSSAEIRRLERRVKLPPKASALRTYVRYYYATADSGPIGRSIEGIYVAKSWFTPSQMPPTDIVIVSAETEVSVPQDAQCALIFVTYTPVNNTAVASCSATLKLHRK